MRQVILHGALGRKFGRYHRFDVASPAEAIRALMANFPGFEEELATAHLRNIGYTVWIGAENVSKEGLTLHSEQSAIRFAPAIKGANKGVVQIIAGAVLIVAGAVLQYVSGGASTALSTKLYIAGATLILGGVVTLLTPVPKIKSRDDTNSAQNNTFNGPVNTIAQGNPVPIGYGELEIGSAVISASIDLDGIAVGGIAAVPGLPVPVLTFDYEPIDTGRYNATTQYAAVVNFDASASTVPTSPGWTTVYRFSLTDRGKYVSMDMSEPKWSYSFTDPNPRVYTVMLEIFSRAPGTDKAASASTQVDVDYLI